MINQPTIFTGCDSKYWKTYGTSFVKSFKFYNPDTQVHIHIINPDDQDLELIKKLPCSFTHENVNQSSIDELSISALKYLSNELYDPDYKSFVKFGLKFCNQETVEEKVNHLMTFSTFAMSRFIKLSELWSGDHPIAAYDIDTICKGPVSISKMLGNNNAGCLSVKGDRFVVSLVAFNNKCKLLQEWGSILQTAFDNKKVYGFLDQDTFVNLSNKYSVTRIERKYCDHTNKSKDSLVMTGKGSTKTSDIFINEKNKWK